MEQLGRLFADLSRDRATRWWIGPNPQCGEAAIISTIAKQVELTAQPEDPAALGRLCAITMDEASYVLARAGTTSLAYDREPPSAEAMRRCKVALADMGREAIFLTNGNWASEAAPGWVPLTRATFDCGVMGWNEQNAFVFWVEEED